MIVRAAPQQAGEGTQTALTYQVTRHHDAKRSPVFAWDWLSIHLPRKQNVTATIRSDEHTQCGGACMHACVREGWDLGRGGRVGQQLSRDANNKAARLTHPYSLMAL